MARDQENAPAPAERLARLYFELSGGAGNPRMLELIHPDVEMMVRKLGGRRRLRGKGEVARFLEELPTRFALYQSVAEEFTAVDDDRVIVEGRLRWMDDDRVLRDDPVIWAFEFREGLLFRSTSARSVSEAQAILAAGAHSAERETA
jgi:ketosteroid isomerase-like protein